MKPVISVLGAGLMGSALIRTFLQQGYQTHAWNRTQSRLEPLVAVGARIAETVSEAIVSGDIVVVNLNNYDTCNRLLKTSDLAESLRGKLLVQLTTGTPRQSREMAEWARSKQVDYLDGAIMVTPDLMGTAECMVLYSGPKELFDKHKTVLEALGGAAVYLGSDYGHASTLDSAILSFYWGCIFGIHQAIALCQAESFPLNTLTSSLSQMVPFVQRLGGDIAARIESGTFDTNLATLEICQQSVRLLIEQSKESGVDSSTLEAFNTLFQRAVDAGHKHSDLAVLNRFMRAEVPA